MEVMCVIADNDLDKSVRMAIAILSGENASKIEAVTTQLDSATDKYMAEVESDNGDYAYSISLTRFMGGWFPVMARITADPKLNPLNVPGLVLGYRFSQYDGVFSSVEPESEQHWRTNPFDMEGVLICPKKVFEDPGSDPDDMLSLADRYMCQETHDAYRFSATLYLRILGRDDLTLEQEGKARERLDQCRRFIDLETVTTVSG
ncbi:TPA: hypothetical protein DD449_00790 [Candidatus Berkelbacteria bacterium]|uniref:Uncharacterized protein n=1 Tax=Berkelbacteria bacterium GW2011_GWE1_39_12 TaxID=1618337 RepID=A0A0G4B529_9BACT|nr:MAG: hypothetical protein UT28_C0001G0928 [Berkelbacteria bacterium GW2011_GWE1_39_12]HBO60208.1 hypothetical protein [Candidatus Berkelbacteria bacterium]